VAEFRALGVDPGLAETGYALVEVTGHTGTPLEWNCFTTDSHDALPQRLQSIYIHFEQFLEKWHPRIMVLEDVFVLPKYPKAALLLGAVRGVLSLAAARAQVEILELKPTEIKLALTGNGRASKEQVERSVRRLLSVPQKIEPEHASDALALAIVALSRSGQVRW
jgi:crossover junction endodeoxyribonuclease RuvC